MQASASGRQLPYIECATGQKIGRMAVASPWLNAGDEKKWKEISEVEKALLNIVGTPCWSIIAGEGSGSLITLAFGDKRQKTKRLSNPKLTDAQRNFDSEFEIYIECAWRIQSELGVICTSTSSNCAGSTMMNALDAFIGRKVLDVKLMYPAGDITIDFDNGTSLVVFADQSNEVDNYCNYVISTNAQIIENGPRSLVSVRTRVPQA